MGDLTTSETCDKCGKTIEILIADFEGAMKDDLPVLCPDCQALTEEAEDGLSYVIFTYKIVPVGGTDFNILGLEGWDLIAVSDGMAYFKQTHSQEEL